MNITKEMDKNFWKCIGVILVSIITVFFIKMTNCVCHLTSVMDGHFTVRENLTNSTSTDEAAKEAATEKDVKAKEAKAKEEAGQSEAEAGQAASQAKAEEGQAASQAKQLKSKTEAETGKVASQAKDAMSIFGGSTSSSNDSSSTGGTTSSTKNLFDKLTETSDGGDEKDDKEEQNKLTELQNAKDAVIASKQDNIKQSKTSLGNSMNAPLSSFDKKSSTSVQQESFTCDINSPTKIVAQYANIESLTKDCDKRIDTCSILKVKDKITGGNLYLDSYRQESYASATGWHS